MLKNISILVLSILTLVQSAIAEDTLSLLNAIKKDGIAKTLSLRESKANLANDLTIVFNKSKKFPAVIFKKQLMETKNNWSKYKTLKLEIKNNSKNKENLNIRIDDSEKVDSARLKNCMQTGFTIPPDGKYHTIYINLIPGYLNIKYMRGMPNLPIKKYGCYFRGDTKFNLETVKSVNIYRIRPQRVCSISIRKFELSTKQMSQEPFVDKYGQYSHSEWPGKILSDRDFNKQLDSEVKNNKKYIAKFNRFDAYGGWDKTPNKLKATGHFRIEKINDKWWFVDPVGKLFWSVGICRAKTLSLPAVSGKRKWFFTYLPPKDSEFAKYYISKGKRYNFFEANLHRKLGPDFKKNLGQYIGDRMRSWGFNSRGAWTDGSALTTGKPLPFTVTVKLDFTAPGQRHDIYSEKFIAELTKQITKWRKLIDNNKHLEPYIIGIFIDNEIHWDRLYTTPTYDYVQYFFKKAGPSDTKNQCVELMQKKYGLISKLNNIWKTNFKSWNSMKSPFILNKHQLKAAQDDISAMTAMIAEKYYSICRKMSKKYFPNKLYLGSRLCTWNKETAEAANKYCDVVSYNLYTYNPSIPFSCYPDLFKIAKKYDKPILIGEFHFGATDRGMFHGGLRSGKTQIGRGIRYDHYMRSALLNPYIIGAHWFQYQDQPLTGRGGDRENYNIGFVSITDTPYYELIQAARKINFDIYKIRYNEKVD